nr:type III toxin-antitoxin system ToxN/AbiQ family toxin [uncultured Anaerostipes sp.]
MNWYIVDRKYINYLIRFDSHVGYVEYGKRLKLHVGILLTVGNFHYYVPISSAKPKHQKMSNSLDFHKLQDESTGYLYAVLNINNMIPVPDHCLTQLKYNQVEKYRTFSNEREKTNYIYLLQKEKALIDNVQDILQRKAIKLYQKCIDKPNSSLAARCCDFKMLEEKCSLYSCT